MKNSFIQYINKNTQLFTSFLGVGLATAGIYFFLFQFSYGVIHLSYQWAVTIGYSLSVMFHFLSNRFFTFAASKRSISPQLIRYICLIIVNYLLTMGIVQLVVSTFSLPPFLGVLIAAGSTTLLSFFILKYWIFKSDPIHTHLDQG